MSQSITPGREYSRLETHEEMMIRARGEAMEDPRRCLWEGASSFVARFPPEPRIVWITE
jgi:hypothetical protein